MQDVNMNNAPQVLEDDELMIDWTGILSKLLKHWKQIVLIGFIFGAIGIVSALTMKPSPNPSYRSEKAPCPRRNKARLWSGTFSDGGASGTIYTERRA